MAYLTKFGTIWGQIPQTSGNVYWVAPAATYTVEGRSYVASDGNDGLSPERAVLTLDYAIGLTTATTGDVIVLLPGSHSWTASVAADVANITITGLPGGKGNPWRQRTSITTTAADEIINVTAPGIEIAYLNVIPVTTKAGIDFSAAGDRLYVHHCSFDLYTAAANTGTVGIGATSTSTSADDVVIEDCYFLCDAAQGEGIAMGDSYDYVIQNCGFKVMEAATWAAAVSMLGTTANSGVVRSCQFYTTRGGTITKAIIGASIASTDAVAIVDNRFAGIFTSEKAIDDFGAGDARISENYLASIGGGSGGALITAIT